MWQMSQSVKIFIEAWLNFVSNLKCFKYWHYLKVSEASQVWRHLCQRMSNTDVMRRAMIGMQIIVLANTILALASGSFCYCPLCFKIQNISRLLGFRTFEIVVRSMSSMSSWSWNGPERNFLITCGRLGQAFFCEIMNYVTPTVSDKLNFPLQSTSKVLGWKNLFIPRFSAYWVPHQRWCSALWARPTAQPSPEPVLQPCRWCDQNWSWSPSFPLSWPVSLPSTVLSLQFSLPVNSNLLLSTLYTST